MAKVMVHATKTSGSRGRLAGVRDDRPRRRVGLEMCDTEVVREKLRRLMGRMGQMD